VQQAAWFKLLCPGAKLGGRLLCPERLGGKKIQGERCLTPLQKEALFGIFDLATTESINLFFGEDSMQAGMDFFESLQKWMQFFASFFLKKSDANVKSLVAINHADFMTWILCRYGSERRFLVHWREKVGYQLISALMSGDPVTLTNSLELRHTTLW